MNISVTGDLEDYLKFKVDSGEYNTHVEVIAEALRLLRERDVLRSIQSEKLNRDLELGIQQMNRGEVEPLEDVIKRIQTLSQQRHDSREKTA